MWQIFWLLISRSGKKENSLELPHNFKQLFVALPLYGTSVSGAVFCVYMEDPELPLNYGGGPDEMLNSDLLKNRKKKRFFNSWL